MRNSNFINENSEVKTCILCGEELFEITDPFEIHCDFCGKITKAKMNCSNGHYICDDCINLPVSEYIKKICLKYKGSDPMLLAVEIMNSPVIKMYGAAHHFITPAVMITCLYNAHKTNKDLKELLEITEKQVLAEAPDQCSFGQNMCGAAVGAGIFLDIYLESEKTDPEDEWSLSRLLVSECIKRIVASGGPRCCKRDSYITIETTVEFLKEKCAVELPLSAAKCTFSLRNKSCKREDCNFYNLNFSLV